MFEKTLPEVKEWLTAYKDLKPKAKKEACSLFLNPTALGDLS
jgi:hypothetical protein